MGTYPNQLSLSWLFVLFSGCFGSCSASGSARAFVWTKSKIDRVNFALLPVGIWTKRQQCCRRQIAFIGKIIANLCPSFGSLCGQGKRKRVAPIIFAHLWPWPRYFGQLFRFSNHKERCQVTQLSQQKGRLGKAKVLNQQWTTRSIRTLWPKPEVGST